MLAIFRVCVLGTKGDRSIFKKQNKMVDPVASSRPQGSPGKQMLALQMLALQSPVQHRARLIFQTFHQPRSSELRRQ